MALEEYNKKRDFSKTAEPAGSVESSEGKLKFVVQRHSASHLHYDFRLEMDGVLKSWAVPKGPSLNPKDKRLAMMVEDHPYSYRTFEGSIPEGNYGGGEVEIWDEGWYEPLNKIDGKSDDLTMRAELHKESLKFIMHGKKISGEFALVKIKNSTDGKSWLLIKHNDEYAVKGDYDAEDFTDPDSKVTLREASRTSKSSGKSRFKNYAPALSGEKKISDFIVPMMAQSAAKPFDSPDWIFEIKWDGYRAVADLRDGGVQLYSRNGLDFSQKFKKVANALKIQGHDMVLDGEIVMYDDQGKPNFQWLQKVGEMSNPVLVYQVFDLLYLNGHSTENLSVLQRKELLKDALTENDVIKYCDHVAEKGEDFYRLAEANGLEGIIAKKADSTYHEGSRSAEWLKIKLHQTEEAVICGFSEPKGSRAKFGSLILGKYNDEGKLVFAGQAGSGFTEQSLKEMHSKMEPLITNVCPFDKIPKTTTAPTWIKPELIAEIKFTEVTKDGQFRHPVFLHLREDKNLEDLAKISDKSSDMDHPADKKPEKIQDVVPVKPKEPESKKNENLIEVNGQQVKVTNQQKIYFPKQGVTKGDVVAYYRSVAEYILPHLHDRPQSMNRFPNGIEGMSFYQKDASEDTPAWAETEKVFSESNDKYINYIICNDEQTLVYLANLGCIEMNVWTARYSTIEKPDYLVLDLDPSDNNTFEDVIETALVVKKILEKAGIIGYPKTSGSSGIHIYIPMGAQYDFEHVKNFGHVLMQMVQQELPNITTLERSLQKRDKGKIYLDYLQNRHGQTLASIYSLRPKNGAPVSMALEWSEVKPGLSPTDWNIENALDRIKKKGDIFKPVLSETTDILKAIEKLQ